MPAEPQQHRLLLPTPAAADALGISTRSLARADSAGLIPKAVKLGGRKLWRRAELEAWTEAGCLSRGEWKWEPNSNGHRGKANGA